MTTVPRLAATATLLLCALPACGEPAARSALPPTPVAPTAAPVAPTRIASWGQPGQPGSTTPGGVTYHETITPARTP